jgi:hypothetical protein
LAAQTLRRLQKAQINLAMVATRVNDDEHPDLVRQRQYCKALREWLIAYGGVERTGTPPSTGGQERPSIG